MVVVMGGAGRAPDPLATKWRSGPRGGVTSKYVLIAAVDPGFPFFIGAPVTGGAKMWVWYILCSPGCSRGPGVEPERWLTIERWLLGVGA